MGFLGENNLEIYNQQAKGWWDPSSPYFKSLQAITPYRLAQIYGWFGDITNRTIVDIGCGGGLISVPLLRAGARVFAVDISVGSLEAARSEMARIEKNAGSKDLSGQGMFCVADARRMPLYDNYADFIIIADVLDHIPDYDKAMREGARILKPGGRMYVNTINRTFLSWLLAIKVGENIGLIPKGTHHHSLFIKPRELAKVAATCNLSAIEFSGERPAIIDTARNWAIRFEKSRSLALAYSVLFQKNN